MIDFKNDWEKFAASLNNLSDQKHYFFLYFINLAHFPHIRETAFDRQITVLGLVASFRWENLITENESAWLLSTKSPDETVDYLTQVMEDYINAYSKRIRAGDE